MIEALKGKGLSKKHKQSLCLVWFVHNVLWARDVNNNMSLGLINLSEDLEAFNSYPLGYESLKMTFKYLLTQLTPKTVNLYGFPWAFIAWAFEAIYYLRQQVNYQEEVSYPRILRWLSAKIDKNVKFLDLFNPPKEAEMTSKRGVIPSKKISYLDTPLEIKAAKRRRKNTSKTSSIIKKAFQVDVKPTAKEYNNTVDNPSTASKDEKKVEPSSLGEQKNYPFEGYCQQQPKVFQNEECLINIIEGFSILAGLSWHLVDEVYILINCGDEFHWVLAVVIVKEMRIRVYDSMYCGPFVVAYAEYLSDGLQVPNDGLDVELLRKRYAALLWKYGEAKAQKPYANNVKDPRRPKPNSVASDEE
ncbi:putative glycerol-3-phosphate 2-O-acyltransferase 6-like [Capsicum annuum]|nr:putative glycerol-3-phosphate 2-O-acyltransferase 6-like [Capsicum annuum]